MKIYEYCYEGLSPLANLTSYVNKDDALYFDIETTGLSKIKNHIYLIGVGYYSDNKLIIKQWFAENEADEINVIKCFIEFSSSFSCLVNYNGASFDIPFINERIKKYGLEELTIKSFDIYTLIKPLKKLLSLPDLTQKSVEQFLNIRRKDKYNGGELIDVYKKYTFGLHNVIDLLLLHNEEDVLNMHYLTKILDFEKLSAICVNGSEYNIKNYLDLNNTPKEELIISGYHNIDSLPKNIKIFKNTENGCFMLNILPNGRITMRVPIINDTLFYYFENYKDYYFLKSEGICILKSMASGVSKDNLLNATKDNCKVSLTDQFFPLTSSFNINGVRLFKPSNKSKTVFIRVSDLDSIDNTKKDEITNGLLNLFIR